MPSTCRILAAASVLTLLAALSGVPATAAFALADDPPPEPAAPSDPGLAGPSWADGTWSPRRGPLAVHSGRGPLPILNVDTGVEYATIQDAVDAATAGDTLRVQVASHAEGQVVIDRDLTLEGAAGTETVTMTVDTGSSGDARGWFLVAAGVDLAVRDLGFDGDGRKVWQAFRHRGTGVFERVRFDDIRFDASGPSYAGTAIAAFGGRVDVLDSTFQNIGRIGIQYFGAAVVAAVADGNTYTGKGTGDFLDYGVEVGAGASAVLLANTVTDCRGVATSDGSGSSAVLASTFFGAGTAVVLERNDLLDSTAGVTLGVPASGDSTASDLAFNRFAGNRRGLVSHSSAASMAENNWWSCNAGPLARQCNFLDGTGLVDFDPWLVLGLGAAPASVPVGGTSTLTADLRRNSDGVDVSGLGTLPDGVPATFDGGGLGSVAPMVGATAAGLATSTFTGTTTGSGDVAVTVDRQSVRTAMTVTTPSRR